MGIENDFQEIKANATPINAAKFLVGTVVSCGATVAIIAAFSKPMLSAKGLVKLMMRFGVFILGCKAGDIAEQYFNEKFDEILEEIKKGKKEIKNESNSNK